MSVLYDFYSPYVAAAVISPEGERVPLWTSLGGVGANNPVAETMFKRAGVYSLAYVTQVSVTINLADLPQISITLNPPYEEAVKILDSTFVEWGRSLIEVQFGYTGGGQNVLSPVYTGLMLQPDISLGDDPTITLKGQGALSLKTDERNVTMTAQSRLEVIRALMLGNGVGGSRKLTLDADEALADSDSKVLLQEVLPAFSTGHRTDWDLITEQCRIARCWPLVLDDTLKLVPRRSRLTGLATKIFALREMPEGRIGYQPEAKKTPVFPILSFSTPSTAIYYPGVLKGLSSGGIKSSTREAQHNFYDATTSNPSYVGAGGAGLKADPKTPGVTNTTNTAEGKDGAPLFYENIEHPASKDKLKAEYDALTSNLGIKVEITTLGCPDLLPGTVVALRGLGKRISEGGNFGIFSVTHTLGGDGYQTSFEAWSNTTKLSEQFTNRTPTDPGIETSADDESTVTANPIGGGVR